MKSVTHNLQIERYNLKRTTTHGKKHWSVGGLRAFQPASNILTGDMNVVRISNDFLPRERWAKL